MFYLAGKTEPSASEEFVKALEGGLREVIQFPVGSQIVTTTGGYPAFDSLRIDLTGGRLNPSRQPDKPLPAGPAHPGITAKSMQITARPIYVDAGRVTMELTAENVVLQYDKDRTGRVLLMPVSSIGGTLKVEIPKDDLQALVLSRASIAAAQQGAKITSLELELTARTERSLSVNLRVHAKKMMMGGTVHISGQIDLDDQLTARLSQMKCDGEGVAGKIAAGFLTPKIKQVDGRSFPLADKSLNGLHLNDVRITSVNPVRVEAAFSM